MAAILNRCNNYATKVLQGSEQSFYRLGIFIAKNPWRTITYCWIFVIVSTLGLLRFHHEKNPLRLWVPPDSNFYSDSIWLMKNFKIATRPQVMLLTAENVLSPQVLKQVALITSQVQDTVTDTDVQWSDVCFKVPFLELTPEVLIKNHLPNDPNSDIFENFDPSLLLNEDLYCAILENMRLGCYVMNLAEIWKFDPDRIGNLTETDIINAINSVRVSPVSGHQMNYSKLLGNVKRNESGHIVSAESLLTFWMINVNFDDVDMDVVGNDAGTADWATEASLSWESAFLNTMKTAAQESKGMSVYYQASRSFGDISGATMFQDMDKLAIGIVMMVIYVQFVLSRYNWLECRSVLGGLGLLCVGMAFLSSCGICSALGISYGPVHTSFPFLLMGLGVDDMFVMMACWNQIESPNKIPLHERMGQMLRHAGPSISLTSFTDVLAFIIGASTILPSLQSFCLYAAVGVFLTFLFAVTFFTACFTLDQRRIEQNRNSILFCIQHTNYEASECSQRNHSVNVFKWVYSKIVFSVPGKVIVILITIISTVFSFEKALKLEQRFDPNWFVPDHTYLHSYIQERNKYFPLMGYEGAVFFGQLDYATEFMNIHNIGLELKNRTDIVNSVESWTIPFLKYITEFEPNFNPYNMTNSEWNSHISKFLYSPRGARYQANFRFEEPLLCSEPAPPVKVSSIEFRFNLFNGPQQSLPAKHAVEAIVWSGNITTGDKFATVWAKIFGSWTTDEVIEVEVQRNLLLALGCVMFCTVFLVTNLQMCFWIFLCVLLTIINMCGYMQMWGLTIDLVACIGLELAIGLCVDFATHVGHTFLTNLGKNREERAVNTVAHIGAAIFFGGGATLLALSMLSLSDAYVFQSFFKIFLLVVIFGLFHGVVLLPVILSLIGPPPYHHLRVHIPIHNMDPAEENIPMHGEKNSTHKNDL